ncbi:hypothetical protein SAMN06265222_103379 [Neorhodopirellula lusitana]|uniref:Uncharacterized protein n=1 Tax=Neorhodopirellula lusitana TaxID=445327 RepID=A0ABY1PXC6_9BACT|nr:hypothetical protein [Neorhodopirellula lusitana]SMP51938.1 hypothetical protein SAMN06265222_103379 [Neorhodopirellula lusitana]
MRWFEMEFSLSRLDVYRLVSSVGLLAMLVMGIGCRPSESGVADAGPASGPRLSSVTLIADRGDSQIRLRDVFQRYQVCSYYSDDAQVTLQNLDDRSRAGSTSAGANGQLGNADALSAPLRVQLNARSLKVDAYAARVRVNVSSSRSGVDQVELHAWFDEPETSNFDSQVMHAAWTAPSNSRLRLERLFVDEVLRSRLLAGSAGAPPQLEWLFADDPMSKLFASNTDSKASFGWLEDGRIGREVLQRIEVTSDQDRFVFWIEAATSLIRRVELPPPMELRQLGGEWRLTVELKDATFQPKSNSEVPFAEQPSFRPISVDAFVPIPPPPPSPLIGRQVGDSIVGSGSGKCQLVALVPGAREQQAAVLRFWSQVLPTFGDSCSFDLIADDPGFIRQLRGFPSPPVTVYERKDAESLIRKLRLSDNAFVLINGEGEVALFEPATDSASLNRALAVVRDVASGTDVVAKIQKDYDTLLGTYRKELKRHVLSNR